MVAVYITIAIIALIIATVCFLILPFVCSYFCTKPRGKPTKPTGMNNGMAAHRAHSTVSSDEQSDCESGDAFQMFVEDGGSGGHTPPSKEVDYVTTESETKCSETTGGCPNEYSSGGHEDATGGHDVGGDGGGGGGGDGGE